MPADPMHLIDAHHGFDPAIAPFMIPGRPISRVALQTELEAVVADFLTAEEDGVQFIAKDVSVAIVERVHGYVAEGLCKHPSSEDEHAVLDPDPVMATIAVERRLRELYPVPNIPGCDDVVSAPSM